MKGVKMRGFFEQTMAGDALRKYLKTANIEVLQSEEVRITGGLSRILAEDVKAEMDVPNFDRSAVDGYAVKSDDTFSASTTNPIVFDVIGSVEMGHFPSMPVRRFQAMRVFTGAPLPKEVDSVVMLEYTERICEDKIEIYISVTPGYNVSQRGEDVKRGERVLRKGTILQPEDIGILAAIGMSRVKVVRRPRVAILSTGNELVEPGSKVDTGKTVDANRFILVSSVENLGGEPINLGIARDDVNEIRSQISRGLMTADLVLVSGGTSVGQEDLVPEAVNSLGKPGIIVHGISMRPGKPTALAAVKGKPVIMLPGYPVAAMMAFSTFVEPVMMRMVGITVSKARGQVIFARMVRRVPSSAGMRDFVRVILEKTDAGYVAEPLRARGAGIISSMVRANGLVVISEESEGIEEGEEVEVTLLRPLME